MLGLWVFGFALVLLVFGWRCDGIMMILLMVLFCVVVDVGFGWLSGWGWYLG